MFKKIKNSINAQSKIFWYAVLGLIAIRMILSVLLMFGLPDAGLSGHFPNIIGGDERGYFKVAQSFARFEAKDEPNFGTIGAALVYVPYIWIFGAEELLDIYKPVFIMQMFVFYSLAILFVSYIGRQFFKSNFCGLVAGAIFVFYPYAFYFLNFGPFQYKHGAFLDAMWGRPVLSDAPSALFVYAAMAVFMRKFYDKEDRNFKNSILAGLLGGFASLVRITNIFACAAIGLAQLAQKKYKEFSLFFAFSLLVFSGQLWFNYTNYGNPFFLSKLNQEVRSEKTDYFYENKEPGHIDLPDLSPGNYLYFLTALDKYVPFFAAVLVIAIFLFVLTIFYCYKKNKAGAVFISSWALFYLMFYGMFSPAARNVRYWLPIIPALILLFIIFVLMLSEIKDKIFKYEKADNNNSGL